MPTCWNCGAEQIAGSIFCSECGASLTTQQPGRETTTALGNQAGLRSAPVQPKIVAAPAAPPEMGQQPSLLVLNGGQRLPLEAESELLLGRTDERRKVFPDIDLSPHGGFDAGVSRRHAVLLLHQDGSCIIEDLGSANGTFINDQQVPPNQPTPLQHGDELKLGTLLLRVELLS